MPSVASVISVQKRKQLFHTNYSPALSTFSTHNILKTNRVSGDAINP